MDGGDPNQRDVIRPQGADRCRDPKKDKSLLRAFVWLVAIVWSVYLIAGEVHIRSNGFAVVVQVMGSIGILFALFLVMKPESASEEEGAHQSLGSSKEVAAGSSLGPGRWALITITLALAVGAIAYHLMHGSSLHQSVVFFIGVPAVLAVILSLTPKAKSATGVIVKGITLALLLSGIVFAEGFVCILMAAPLFYLVGIAIGYPIDRVRRKRQSEGKVYSVVGIGLLLLSVEGAVPGTSFPRHETISVTRSIDASLGQVRQALASTPDFDKSLPFYLRLGFPRPVGATGNGLEVGDRRTIFFGDESPMEPMGDSHHHVIEPESREGGGTLELEIVRSGKRSVVFEPLADTTAFTHWIGWGRSIVSWRALDSDTTEVTWTFHYERRLSPSWYFGPWQRYAATKAVGFLIDTVATP
jgi:hypothetical protein